MNFHELCNKIKLTSSNLVVGAIVNADVKGQEFGPIQVGKAEVWTLPGDREQAIIFSSLKDLTGKMSLTHVCIIIRESEVDSVNEYEGKTIVLTKTSAYSIMIA